MLVDLRITLQRRLTFCSHASQLERCVELMNTACSPEAAKRQPQETSEETSETRSRSNGGLLMHKPFEEGWGDKRLANRGLLWPGAWAARLGGGSSAGGPHPQLLNRRSTAVANSSDVDDAGRVVPAAHTQLTDEHLALNFPFRPALGQIYRFIAGR